MIELAVLISFGLIAIFLLFGMIGENNLDNHKDYTIAFCTIIAAIAVIVTF